MILLCYLLFLIYAITIVMLIHGFSKIKNYTVNSPGPKNRFTIVVPFRNEAKNLPNLLQSLSELNYPKELYELILVDDDSAQLFRPENYGFKISVINNKRVSPSPKKDAILSAINLVSTDWIITTDADCTAGPEWLTTYDSYIQQQQPEMIAGAVAYSVKDLFLHHFQQLDLSSLQGATIGTFGINNAFMCNGANFAYTKSLFMELGGFKGNDSIASGDDVFLLQKAVARFPGKVHYLKAGTAVITTKPLNNWKSLFYQRVRWASKTTSYQSNFGKFLALSVFAGNCSWLLAFSYSLITASIFCLPILLMKILIDYILINQTNFFLKKKTVSYIKGSLFYPFFSTTVALYSIFGKYEWKGRHFNSR